MRDGSPLGSVDPRRLRVAYFAGTMRPGHDGVTRVLYRLIDDLDTRPIDYLFFSPIVPRDPALPPKFREVPSVRFPLYKDYRLALPGDLFFERELGRFRPDIIHINSPCSLGLAAVQYGWRRGIPVVATYHTHFPSYAKYYRIPALEPLGWNYLRGVYGRCARVYVPSLPILNELRERDLGSLEFLPHGVDTEVFHPRFRSEEWRREHGVEGKSVLLYAGRLVWEKDLATLADAWRLLSARRRDVAMVLAGDGPVRAELERMMPGALFLGHLNGPELSTAFASSDLFVFPSTTETFGNVSIEAMASGVPPITAREGGAYGVVEHGVTGVHVNPRDPEDLARTIESLLSDNSRRDFMAAAALKHARTQSWPAIFDRLIASYAELVGAARVAGRPRRQRRAA